MLAFEDFLKALNGIFQLDKLAFGAGKHLGDKKRLRQKALDLAGTGNRQSVFVGKFVHAQNGDNILQRFIFLQNFLYAASYPIVFFADNRRRQYAAGGIERIDRR